MSELGEYSKLENKELRTEFELTNFPFPGTTDNDSDDGSQGQNSLNIITLTWMILWLMMYFEKTIKSLV